MQIIMDIVPSSTIAEFAKQYGLELHVTERKEPVESNARYYANFKRAEIKGNGVLISESGNGSTPKKAIDNYAAKIEMKTLVIDAYYDSRQEIKVPRLVFV